MTRATRIALALALALPLAAASLGAQAGSFVARTLTIDLEGSPAQVDVFVPSGPAAGVAIIAHGFTRSRQRHSDTGRALAESGIVAVIPDLPNVMDLWGNGSAIVDLARQLEAGALDLPPVERSQLVLIGTSAGGLATVLAASKLPGVAGWVGLDPVDRTGTGMYAASKLKVPAIVLLGDAGSCNLFGSGSSLASSVPNLLRKTRIEGASHCDFEAPTNRGCTMFCGSSSPEMQRIARDETVHAAADLLRLAREQHASAKVVAPPLAAPIPAAPAPAPATVEKDEASSD